MSRHSTTSAGGDAAPDARDQPGALGVLGRQQWIPVLRSRSVDEAVATALACRDGGCRAVELTYSTPGVLEAVAELVAAGLVVGVGTVRLPEQVTEAATAGASFVVSFYRPPGFLAAAAEAEVLAVPGALTPQEVAAALDGGAEAVKLFPGRLVAPGYLGDLRAVLGPAPLLVTGGIPANRAGIQPWLDAGAWCVGVGASLGSVAHDGHDVVAARAAALSQPVA